MTRIKKRATLGMKVSALSKPLLILLVIVIPLTGVAQIPDGYYELAEGRSGSELKSALHDLISDHVKYPYTSGSTDVWDILKQSDEDPDNPDNVILIYTGRSQAKTENSGESGAGGSNRWNREHVWSKSHGFPVENDTAYTDCHHLRPADESVNSSRSTLDFDNGGSQHVEATECFYDGDSWEPRDAVKGDVARMMFYMVVRYDPGFHTDNSIYDLELVDFTGTETNQPTFGKLSTLLQWNAQDPVDEFESNRNEVVFGYQGNRNPFIDHPEWADSIFTEQLAPNTRIGFTTTSMAVEEDVGSVTLELAIINPDPSNDTQCEISWSSTSGDTDDLGGFESAVLIFPAGSYSLQTLEIPIEDDDIAEEQETFIFGISNVTGGDSASVNGNDTFVLTIHPNDQEVVVEGLIISEVMDGNRSGGEPKFIEITNTSSETIDISDYRIWRGSNGSEPTHVTTISTGTLLAGGASWLISHNESSMADAGFPTPDQSSGSINGNGNDVYQLRNPEEEYVDCFGTVGDDTPWYQDAFAVRLPAYTTGNANYDESEWEFTSIESGFPDAGSPGTPGVHVFDPTSISESTRPDDYFLMRTYPNPFNSSTIISLTIPLSSNIKLDAYDINGRHVSSIMNRELKSGKYEVSWNGTDASGNELPSGLYFVRISSSKNSGVQRLSILR